MFGAVQFPVTGKGLGRGETKINVDFFDEFSCNRW
jgi:hypothetical protein